MDSSSPGATQATRPVRIEIANGWIDGDLSVPESPHGIVLFAHGSGSSRFSPRNRYVARTLDRRHFATLLIDLLTEREDELDSITGHLRFDVEMLAARLGIVAEWIHGQKETGALPIGLFGASTGGGAALIAAARQPEYFRCVVSRGGRPDLAGSWLRHVLAPTLLIVGERDEQVIRLNQDAMAWMQTEVRLEIIPGATHLFEERGALELVAEMAGDWFEQHLQ